MSANLRKKIGPFRGRVQTCLGNAPDFNSILATEAERVAHLKEINKYQLKVMSCRGAFKTLVDEQQNLEGLAADEQVTVDGIVQTDRDILFQCEDAIVECKARKDEVNDQRTQVVPVPNNHNNNGHRNTVKLPKFELPKFAGDVLKWQSFWDAFKASVHEDQSMSNIQKMTYLKGYLVSDALKCISGLSFTNDNYDIAVKTLTDRFGDKQRIIDSHYKAISSLSSVTNSNNSSLRIIVDKIEHHLLSLEALGEEINHRMMVLAIFSKLSSDVLLQLEKLNEGNAWDTVSLREQLQKLIKMGENAETNCTTSKSKDKFDSNSDLNKSKSSSHLHLTSSTLTSTDKTKSTQARCDFCDENHYSDQCKTFATLESRKTKINGKCFGCLKPGHSIRECRSVKKCFHCKREHNHHQSLCPKKYGSSNSASNTVCTVTEAPDTEETESTPVTTTLSGAAHTEGSLLASGVMGILQTAQSFACSNDNDSLVPVRILLDGGSHRSYISSSLSKKLSLKATATETLSVFSFGSDVAKTKTSCVVSFRIELLNGNYFNICANTTPTITGLIHRSPIDFRLAKLYYRQPLADSVPQKGEDVHINILIGADYYYNLVPCTERINLHGNLCLIGSKFGWLLSGRQNSNQPKSFGSTTMLLHTALSHHIPNDPLMSDNLDLKTLWDLESIGIEEHSDSEGISDEKAVRQFNDTVKYDNNRYYVKWPWKFSNPDLPLNYELSLGRLNSSLRRLHDQPHIIEQYQAIINTQLANGIIEKVNQNIENDNLKHYIPHHAVFTPGKLTTKIRIVYDGSAKSKKDNLSANECLHRGPVILDNVCALLIRFRLNKVALIADIEKAFLQVWLQDEDRDVTRFLWLKNLHILSTDNNIHVYRFARVPFGYISSPFLLAATVYYHLMKDGSDVALSIIHNIYVDNVITGVSCVKDALQFYSKAKQLFGLASMNIREWTSNSTEFINSIPNNDQCSQKIVKVLGIEWDTESDKMSICMSDSSNSTLETSKRTVLKYIASIFDPLGLLCPTVLLGKLFLQKLWIANYDWDNILPSELQNEWNTIVTNISPISSYQFPRYIMSIENVNLYEIHCFCDASQKAYGIAIYIRFISTASCDTKLLFGKAGLAPIPGSKSKKSSNINISLPRLELLAVHIGSKCLEFIVKSLPFIVIKKFIWTDSQCVLHWLNSTKPLTAFVKNRITTIKQSQNVIFRYVPTDQNPADSASRGCNASELTLSNLWWNVPSFLSNANEDSWPPMNFLSNENFSSSPKLKYYHCRLTYLIQYR